MISLKALLVSKMFVISNRFRFPAVTAKQHTSRFEIQCQYRHLMRY